MKKPDLSAMIMEINGDIDSVIGALNAVYDMVSIEDNMAYETGILYICLNQLSATLKKSNKVGMHI